jgi:hypothetical protein
MSERLWIKLRPPLEVSAKRKRSGNKDGAVFSGHGTKSSIRNVKTKVPIASMLLQFLQDLDKNTYGATAEEDLELATITIFQAVVTANESCYATDSFFGAPRYDDVEVDDEDGIWYGKLQLVFAFKDFDLNTYSFAVVDKYGFVDPDNPICPVFQVPWVTLTHDIVLLEATYINKMVDCKPDRTCPGQFYVDSARRY